MVAFTGVSDTHFAERMLEDGFYPENVPPVFAIENLHEAAIKPLASGNYLTDKPTEGCRYNASKRGGQRRVFTMPNPVFMVDAAAFFIKRKSEIDEHLLISTNSSSYPTFSPSEGRPISIASFPEFHKRRRRDLALSRYIVRTDVSRFFHSIYTHALPWALHGKPEAKKDRKPESSTIFGNRLDWLLRQAQDGQTVGIPVGPDFSRIVSEIIGAAIDKTFRVNHANEAPMLRLVDDIYIGADNLDDAHSYLSGIRDALRAYELDINEAKTVILNSSADLEPYWPVEIRREIERYADNGGKKSQKRADFIHFLDDVLRKATDEKDEGIVKFAVRKIDELEVWATYWDILEPFLVRVAINFPHCWDYVARVVAWRNTVKSVDKPLWCDVVHRAIKQNGNSGHDSEIAWALWLLKELAQPLESQAFDLVLRRCGPLPCLLALDIHKNTKPTYKVPKELLLDRLGEKPMTGSNWLLAYEADRQFDLKIKSRNLQGNAFFKQLYDDDVSFYNQKAKLFVFEDVEDVVEVKSAIENPTGSYDDVYEESENDEVI
ncbi:RNA-directed DNA polymerase [Sinorhizobium fredii]|uniref:RNA-directed DNA polymerase n=1 Tax=Rhizobium fredii TaxID=380 RepID=UPI0035112E6B